MARTISTAPRDPARPSVTTDDLDGLLVDGLEALRQRIVQAIRFRFGTWFLARTDGLDYGRLIGHRIPPALAAAALNDTVREEGGAEIIALHDIQYSLSRDSRVFSYSVHVESIHGPLYIAEDLG